MHGNIERLHTEKRPGNERDDFRGINIVAFKFFQDLRDALAQTCGPCAAHHAGFAAAAEEREFPFRAGNFTAQAIAIDILDHPPTRQERGIFHGEIRRKDGPVSDEKDLGFLGLWHGIHWVQRGLQCP